MDFSFDDHVAAGDAFSDNDVGREDGEEREETEAKDDGTGTASKDPPKKASRVRNPQPKLNPERLCGNRGIAKLPKIFEDVLLNGKGHEKEDLDKVLKTLEHWSHRLFPKFSFDDALDRIQKLGFKKPVQVCLNKIRLDMNPEWDDEVVDEEGNIQTDVQNDGDGTSAMEDDRFDLLHASIFGEPSTSGPSISNTPHAISPSTSHGTHVTSDNFISQQTIQTTPLTDEQKVKMEENRRLATERLRAARLRAISARTAVQEDDLNKSANGHAAPDESSAVVAVPQLMDEYSCPLSKANKITNSATTSESPGDFLSENDIMAIMEADLDVPLNEVTK